MQTLPEAGGERFSVEREPPRTNSSLTIWRVMRDLVAECAGSGAVDGRASSTPLHGVPGRVAIGKRFPPA